MLDCVPTMLVAPDRQVGGAVAAAAPAPEGSTSELGPLVARAQEGGRAPPGMATIQMLPPLGEQHHDPSNAILSTLYPELRWYGAALADATGKRTLLCCFLQYIMFPGFGLLLLVAKPQAEAATVGLAEPNALHYVQCIAVSISIPACI